MLHQSAILSLGTLFGRGVAVLAMPLLTRLYTPEDFSVLASYSAILSVLAVIACLRFEVAIPLPKCDAKASALLVAALVGPLVIAAVVSFYILLSPKHVELIFPRISSPAILWLIPAGVLLVGAYQALQFWGTRKREFGAIARTRFTQAVAGVSAMTALGLGGVGSVGLTFGHMIMNGAGAVSLGLRSFRSFQPLVRLVTPRRVLAVAHEYRRFPLWSMPEALANVAGLQVPILLIAALAAEGEAGQLMLAMQVMVIPMALVGNSVGQVYLSRAPDEYREGRIRNFTFTMMRRLAIYGAGPIALIGLSAPWTFPILFGEVWQRAGFIAAMMVPWIIVQFIAVPVSMVFHVVGRTLTAMILQISGFVLRLGGALVALWAGSQITEVLIVTTAIFYFAMIEVIRRILNSPY